MKGLDFWDEPHPGFYGRSPAMVWIDELKDYNEHIRRRIQGAFMDQYSGMAIGGPEHGKMLNHYKDWIQLHTMENPLSYLTVGPGRVDECGSIRVHTYAYDKRAALWRYQPTDCQETATQFIERQRKQEKAQMASMQTFISALRNWASYNNISLEGAKITLDVKTDPNYGNNGAHAKRALVEEINNLAMGRYHGEQFLGNGNLKIMGIEVEMFETRTTTTRSKL